MYIQLLGKIKLHFNNQLPGLPVIALILLVPIVVVWWDGVVLDIENYQYLMINI